MEKLRTKVMLDEKNDRYVEMIQMDLYDNLDFINLIGDTKSYGDAMRLLFKKAIIPDKSTVTDLNMLPNEATKVISDYLEMIEVKSKKDGKKNK